MADVSLDTVLATGSTTARTLAAMASDMTNVVGFGAALNGTTSDSAAFTAAYNYVPHNGIIYIPPGNLNATVTESTSKSVLWVAEGRLDYGTSSPGTNPVFSIGDGDVLETFYAGRKVFAKTVTNNTVTNYGALSVNTTWNGNPSSLSILAGMDVLVTNNTTAGGGGTPGILSTVTVNGSQGGGSNICFFGSATISSSATAGAAAFYGQTLDNPGSFGGVGIEELDLFTWNNDPITNAVPNNTMRGMVLFKANVLSGKTSAQIGRGITVATDGTAQIGVAYYGIGTLYYAAYDASGFTPTGSVFAGLRLAPNMGIDFSTIAGTTSSLNLRRILYNSTSGNLEYQKSGTAVWSLEDNGKVIQTASLVETGIQSFGLGGTNQIVTGTSKVIVFTSSAITLVMPPAPTNPSQSFMDLNIFFSDANASVSWGLGTGTQSFGGAAMPTSVATGANVTLRWVQSASQWIHVVSA